MSGIDLNLLSLSELKQLQKDIAKTIDGYEDRRKSEARSELEAAAKRLGYSLNDLLDAAPARKRTVSEAKYRNPENEEMTWTGRGRKPTWIIDALSSGKSLDDLLIA